MKEQEKVFVNAVKERIRPSGGGILPQVAKAGAVAAGVLAVVGGTVLAPKIKEQFFPEPDNVQRVKPQLDDANIRDAAVEMSFEDKAYEPADAPTEDPYKAKIDAIKPLAEGL